MAALMGLAYLVLSESMQTNTKWKLGQMFLALTLLALPGRAQFDGIRKTIAGNGGDNPKTADGLKQALAIGAKNAVDLTGHVDGYLKNEAIKIVLPEKMRGLEKGLRAAGMGAKVDDFEVSMNRAAETAAPAAQPIFEEAIKSMTFEDARGILSGGDTAATEYFKRTTDNRLKAAFRPPVQSAMDGTGVVKKYKELTGGTSGGGITSLGGLTQLGGRGGMAGFDITDYVVTMALDGVF